MASDVPALTRGEVARRAWPIIVANATVPLLGLVDTAVIGNLGGVRDLGAIALGSLVFSFLSWSFGFLRMGTTGFVAQAAGAGDAAEVRAVLGRALLIACGLGLSLLALRGPLIALSLLLLHGSAEVEQLAGGYLDVRMFGVPASLATLCMRGTLIGLGASRALLGLELLLNGVNLALDLLFAGWLGWGARGVALGTTLAEWLALGVAALLVRAHLSARRVDTEPFFPWARIRQRAKLTALLAANADIMVRTVLLLAGFAFFTDRGARFGDATLAANHVLLQFVAFAAFFLDGYAFVAEALVGAALGARDRRAFDLAVRRSTELSLLSAAVLALGTWGLGPHLLALLTDLPEVSAVARAYLPYASAYVLLSGLAFQLDGVFIGATRTRDMRNASIASTGVFVLSAWALSRIAGNDGLWTAFIVFVLARAAALGAYYPALRRAVGG
ncbi:MAG: MATE family efflux transporter [Polyangiales bacterium]